MFLQNIFTNKTVLLSRPILFIPWNWKNFLKGPFDCTRFSLLNASLHLRNQVCLLFVCRSVCWCQFCKKTRKIIIFEQIIVVGGILDESHVITSSYNHFIITRTHRWPYRPCYVKPFNFLGVYWRMTKIDGLYLVIFLW